MAGPTVYKDVADDLDFTPGGKLFTGQKFWVAQRVPSRNRLLDEIKANGGEVVLLERKADYMIADHFRRDCPPGSISYEFVDKSIKQGELQDPENHMAGPPLGQAREPGAISQPTKSGRAAYTAEEDRILYKWVRDSTSERGGLASGNEIYKQLAAKYPRHTWQSWRDRYLKQLRNRPPSAFNIPDNAPPSPPSDQLSEGLAPGPSSSKPVEQPTPQPERKPERTSPAANANGKQKIKNEEKHSLDELLAMFSNDDWLALYAFVEEIDSVTGEELDVAWAAWAEAQGNHTAGQWRQYYEHVVRPQWLSDPKGKREQIKKKMERKLDGDISSQSQPISQQQHPEPERPEEATVAPAPSAIEEETLVEQPPASEEESFEELLKSERTDRVPPAYKFFAREKRQEIWNEQPGLNYTELHRILLNEWHTLTSDQKAPYVAMEQTIKTHALDELKETAKLSSEIKILSSSTARPESPKFYKDLQEKFVKRMRGHDIQDEDGVEQSRPIKRRRSASPTPTRDTTEFVGTLDQPLEISSAESSASTQSEPDQEQIRQDMLRSRDNRAMRVEHEHEAEKEVESIESDAPFDIGQTPPHGYERVSEDDLPSNTPTPRANRQKISNFDTQAILSSPNQDTRNQFSQPHGYTEKAQHEQPSSSPAQELESDASTTQSLQEFRRSLDDKDMAESSYPDHPPQRHRTSPSPAPSSAESTSSDPDPPLEADEVDEFFQEQHEQGFTDDFIIAALKRTRMRPLLAVKVLDEWREGRPLPDERGIWSVVDDEEVESADGLALAMLQRKHTMDGWGGITERMLFLEGWRSR
ncbi:hypothetical protein BDW02DRAFT_145981 [Decorospora gaudefroyi]|uniref:DNA-binding protein RAP1 n=1 Tax=Decorospora gaudefroyi TaxID=184978 RepID=A0A6A5K593_9PLEO|nr:hypothetical protein BDW02DRAFT_145981 [Decorospora gaudefroyi]